MSRKGTTKKVETTTDTVETTPGYTAKEHIQAAQNLIDENHPFIGLITRMLNEVKSKLD